MYKITLKCSGVPHSAGAEAAADIINEFAEHRPQRKNVVCTWDGTDLVLKAESETDEAGLALKEEFSDCLSAIIAEPFGGEITVESVTRTQDP